MLQQLDGAASVNGGAPVNRLASVNGHRSADGRFAPGCPGGPGRPRRVTEAEYLRAMSEECPPETWRAICRRAVADALAGDARARDWLAKYLLGNPAELPTLWAATAPDRSQPTPAGAKPEAPPKAEAAGVRQEAGLAAAGARAS